MVCINHMRADEKKYMAFLLHARSMGRKPDKKLDIFVRNIYGLHI